MVAGSSSANVPIAANAGYYAEIVRDKAILRRLVEAGTRIASLGYAGEGDIDDVVDNAQAEVYKVIESEGPIFPKAIADRIGSSRDAVQKLVETLRTRAQVELAALRSVLSTGSPLAPKVPLPRYLSTAACISATGRLNLCARARTFSFSRFPTGNTAAFKTSFGTAHRK